MKSEDLFNIDTVECPKNRCDKVAAPKATDMVDKSCPLDDDMQDLYGVRNYGLPSSRPTMISAKYRQKEERRKVLKLSMNKLKRIEDPESSLRRSVLINNTVKRLQREAREEKSQKNQMNSTYSQNKCFGISSDFITKQQEENLKTDVFATALGSRTSDQLLDITNLPDGKTTCSGVSKLEADCLGCDEAIADLTFPVERLSPDKSQQQQQQQPAQPPTRKRSIDEVLDDECCDVLGQFYLPPTPRMMPLLEEDEDEDVNVVDIDTPALLPPTKRPRDDADSPDTLCCLTAADRLRDNIPCCASSASASSTSTSTCTSSQSLCSSSPSPLAPQLTLSLSASTSSMSSSVSSSPLSSMLSQTLSSSSCTSTSLTTQFDEWSIDDSILLSSSSLQSTPLTAASPTTSSLTPFSCGHSSMLNEIVVYHNLIASFES